VAFQVKMDYDGPELDPAVTYLLTYQIGGTEDTYVHTARITGDTYTSQDHYASTASSDAELTATVVEISD
jgi:hypothetical protein